MNSKAPRANPEPSASDGREILLRACNWMHKRGHKSAATDLDYNWNDPGQPGDGSCVPLHLVPASPARAEPAGGWVACESRMPPTGLTVLVDGGCAFFDGIDWRSAMTAGNMRKIEWSVTHWQPLPQAPQSQHPSDGWRGEP